PPPPAYACDGYQGYGYGAYGGYSECVDDGQYYSRRDMRRARRDVRHARGVMHGGHGGQTFNGMPVMAAYIVPMEMMDSGCGMCGGWECCDPVCGDGFCCEGMPCGEGMPGGDCGPCAGGACEIGGYPQDGVWEGNASEAYPPSHPPGPHPYGGPIPPMPVPPAQEGPWNPPATSPSSPRTTPEPDASRPVESATWLPSRLP